MTSFEQALSAPQRYFRRLKNMEIVQDEGRPIVRRTHSVIESEIRWNGRRYLLLLPFRSNTIRHIESFEEELRNRRQGPLLGHIIMYEEATLLSSCGHKHCFDIFLQELPDGMMLEEAVHYYHLNELRDAVLRMKSRLDAIGFCHNNLRPANILVCHSGVVRPLRYWYADWEVFSDNDISQILEFIDKYDYPEANALRHHLAPAPEEEEEPKNRYLGEVQRYFRYGHYGFIDSDGHQVTPPIYTWASEFNEGRAIVARHNKMGAIDLYGKKVVPVIYNHLEFDIATGCFSATNGKYNYLLDYEGKIIRRWPAQEERVTDNK